MRGVLVFLYFVFNFLIEKLMARVLHAPVSGWCLHHSGGACDTTRWPNLAIHHLSGYVAVSSSTWYDVCGLIMVRLPLIIDCFSFFSLYWQLKCTIILFVYCFSISVLLSLIKVFFYFVLKLQFLTCFIFHFSPHSFNIYFFYSFSPPKSVFIFGWCFRIHPLSFYFLFWSFSLLLEFYLFTI